MELAARFPFLDELTAPAAARIDAEAKFHDAPPGAQLIRRGDRAGGVYLVERGVLRVYNISAAGRESTLYWIEPGESCILAMNCVFARVRYPAWVEASEEPTRFAVIPAALFRDLFAVEPAVQRFTFDVMAGRIFELMTLLEEAISLDVEKRVASLLVRKCDEDGVVAMSQTTIAGHLGTAREVVTRVLRGLSARGLVRTTRGAVEVIDPPALAALVHD